MFNIGHRNHVPLKYADVVQLRAAYQFSNLQDFLDIYYQGASVLLHEQDFYDLTMAYFRRIHAETVHAQCRVGEVVDSVDQVRLEPKPAGFALHPPPRCRSTTAASRTWWPAAGWRPRSSRPHRSARARTCSNSRCARRPRARRSSACARYTQADAVFYAGDDVTDEDAFAALGSGDLGLKSGEGPTLANFRVTGPAEVARALALLADLREGDVHELVVARTQRRVWASLDQPWPMRVRANAAGIRSPGFAPWTACPVRPPSGEAPRTCPAQPRTRSTIPCCAARDDLFGTAGSD